MDAAEELREGARHAPGAASDFEHCHIFRILPLTDILEIVEDIFLHRDFARAIELLIAPGLLAGENVVTRIFARAPVPIAPHAF